MSPLPRIHNYHNKRLQVKKSQYLIPTYSWTPTSIPNWTCSVVTISPFQCMAPSMWLTNCANPRTWLNHQLEKDVGYKVLQFIQTMKIKKLLGHKPYSVKTQQLLQKKDELGHMSPIHNNMLMKKFCIELHQLWRPLKQSLYMFRVVRKENLNTYTWIGLKLVLKNWVS